jgi:hypothetical protein
MLIKWKRLFYFDLEGWGGGGGEVIWVKKFKTTILLTK